MKLLAIACLVAVACAYPSRLGEDKCTYGPSYWCENYKQAIECKAIEHCRKFVWKPKEADNCDQCKAAVQQFHTLVTTNSSKVLEILKNICGGLPSSISAECQFAVDNYGSQIISALAEMTADAEKICQELELCPSQSTVKIIKKIFVEKLKTSPQIIAYKSSVKADYCEDCKLVFGELKDVLQDQDLQKEIVAAMEALCAELGSFADQCKSYVDMYLPLVLDELASLDDPTEVCTELGLCNSTKKAKDIMNALNILQPQAKKLLIPLMPGPVILTPPKKNEKATDDECDECKAAMKQFNYYLTNNSTKLVEIMDNSCKILYPSKASKCKTMVDAFGPMSINQLKQLTSDSDKLCKELGMCKSAGKEQFIKTLLLRNLKSHPYILTLKSAKQDFCNDCKLVFAEIKDMLEDKSMQQEITNLLESLCAELGSFADQCKTYVDAFLPLILEELDTLDDPTKLCTELGLCNSTKKAVEVLKASQLIPAVKKAPVAEAKKIKSPKAGPECALCEFVMNKLDSILGDNATKEEIEAALEEVCNLLPSTLKSECDAFVEEYGPEIIQLLLEALQPEEVCSALGLCSSGGKRAKPSLKKPTDETCDLCKMVVTYLESILKSNATEEEIKEALEEICNVLPSSLKTECLKLVDKYTTDLVWLLTEFPPYAVCKCDAIVDEYGDLIIKLILGEITPDEVCEALNLCTASLKKLPIKDGCALGEPYWCKSYANALECNALKHCNYLA